MPCVTYLSDSDVRAWSSVPDDADLNQLLLEMREQTGESWIIGRHQIQPFHANCLKALFCKPPQPFTEYTLYADCHGEWQIINLATSEGGSLFHPSAQSRESIMNYMIGYMGGLHHSKRREATLNPQESAAPASPTIREASKRPEGATTESARVGEGE